jgi:hypothetical protein
MAARLREQRGSVLVTAIFVLAAMMMIGLATVSIVDTQTRQSGGERVRESSFNLSEGALSAQTFVLGRVGTGTQSSPFPSSCDSTSNATLCPNATNIADTYDQATQKDFDPASTHWHTEVRDNVGGLFYDPQVYSDSSGNTLPCPSAGAPSNPPCYDANGDRQLWVRSTATVHGRTRSIVALIRIELRNVDFPRYAIAGGWFQTTDNGKKVIVDSTGSLGVSVRCNQAPPSSGCLDYDPSKGQLAPPGNYQLNSSNNSAISPDDLQALEDFAKANGTYYTSCPGDPNGSVVVVESGECSYTNSAPPAPGQSKCCNSPSKPGVLIIKHGTLSLGGNIDFYGLIYMANLDNLPGVVASTGGNATIVGGVVVDGPGGISSGSNGQVGVNNANIMFDPRAFDNVQAAGTAGVVQNTWRELAND